MCSDVVHSTLGGHVPKEKYRPYQSASKAIRDQLDGLLSLPQAVYHMVAGFMGHYCMAGQKLITSLTA